MSRRFLFILAWLGLFLGFAYRIDPGFWRSGEGHYETALVLRDAGDHAGSLEELDRALLEKEGDPGLLRARGYAALELGRIDEARSAFTESLDGAPGDPEGLLGLATAALAMGDHHAAREALSRLPARLDTFERRLSHARLLVEAGDMHGAWTRYHALANETGADDAALEAAAMLATRLERWDDVSTLASRLAVRAADAKTARHSLGQMAGKARESGRPELALRLLSLGPGPENLEARASLNLELERFAEAADLHGELVASQPGSTAIRKNLAYALERSGRLDEAEAEYERLWPRDPEDRDLLLRYVSVLNQKKRYARAWEILSSLPMPSPDSETHWLQAQTAHWAGESSVASGLLESWSGRNPDDPRPYLLLAEDRRQLGDTPGRIDAIQSYVDRVPDDPAVRRELADAFVADGRLPEAILQYRELSALKPDDSEVLTRLGVLLETSGDLESARRRYEQAAAISSKPSVDLAIRLARVHMWTGDPEGAVSWYEEVVSHALDASDRREASVELAEALLAAGRGREALRRVSPFADRDPPDPALQLLAARAASESGDPASTVRYLERLQTQRPLTGLEAEWIAGAQRASGDAQGALESYEALLRERPSDPELLLAVGDLRFDRGDAAGARDVYEQIPASSRPPGARLGLARARSGTGDRPGAIALYKAHLGERPGDSLVRLELARVLMLAGQSEPAVAAYERYASEQGEDGIGLELTRAYLQEGDFVSAEAVATRSESRGEDTLQVRLARAQALGGQGRIREADRLLASLVDVPTPPSDPTWTARLAEARNQPLGAFLEAQRAIQAGAEPAAELHLLQARALGSRGDVSRALASLERAQSSGADTARVQRTLEALRWSWASELEIPALLQEDDGGIRIPQGGARVRFNVVNRFRLGLSTNLGRIEQRGVSFDRWVMAATVDRWFPQPELKIGLGLGWEEYGVDGGLLVADGSISRTFATGAEVILHLERSSLWSAHDEFQARGFNRVVDASALGPDFHTHTAAGQIVFRGTAEWETRLEIGVSEFQDGNRQIFGYAHRQIPIVSRAGRWFALRPNLYVDGFSYEVPGYASPSLSSSFGLSVHGVREWSRARIEADVNPNLLWVDDEWGPGGSGMVELTFPIGGVHLGGTLFGYYRGPEDYSLWRFMTRIRIPFGGGVAR